MIIRGICYAALMCAVWIALAMAVMLRGTINTAFVPASTPIPETVSIVGQRGGLLVVQGQSPDYVKQLYENGALFVLPARKKTCLNLQNANWAGLSNSS